MKYFITGTTAAGNHRSHNEDCILLGESVLLNGSKEAYIFPPFMCAVCDGVGGENAGEVASKTTAELLSASEYNTVSELKNRIFEIHDRLVALGEQKPDLCNMQTTLCLVTFDRYDIPYCINVGDSRAYIFKDGALSRITTDQSLAQYLTETGKAEKFGIDLKSYRNVIISSVGNPKQYPMVDLFSLGSTLGDNDMIIICSDGISDYISDKDFLDIISGEHKALTKQNMLIDKALENGSKDNLSAVIIQLA